MNCRRLKKSVVSVTRYLSRQPVHRLIHHRGRNSPAEAETSLHVFFDERTDQIKSSELSKIDEAAKSVRNLRIPYRVAVEGYSDAEGSADYNESISARRADAVRQRLIENGVPQSKISIHGRGEDSDLSGHVSDSWKARRVEVVFVPEPVLEAVT